MTLKTVFRYDPSARIVRLFRIVWDTGKVGSGGYSTKLSVGLQPKLFSFVRDFNERIVTVCGVRVHHKRSYGGRFV